MNTRKMLLLLCLLGIITRTAIAQNGANVSVNNYTGTANVTIPLFQVTSGSLSLQIAAAYNANGVKVKDAKGIMGMNWGLIAGGEINRTLRGLPDDMKYDNARLGWLYNTNGTKINNFTISNSNSTTICSDETTDNSYISANFSDLSDTEPDVFNINAPGLSCQFVFDKDHVVRTIPYQDLKITYQADPASGKINSFNVINGQGILYRFDQTETETRKTSTSGTVSYFKRQYDQFVNGISFARTWKLTGIIMPSGDFIQINYINGKRIKNNDKISVILPGSSASTTLFSITTSYMPSLISQVYNTDVINEPTLSFTYLHDFTGDYNEIGSIKGMGRSVGFSYKKFETSATSRSFLNRITISGSGIKNTFDLAYYGLGVNASGDYINLPDSTSKEIDYWGYYNASSASSLTPQIYTYPLNTAERYRVLPPGASSSYIYTLTGADRSPNLLAAVNGSLMSVTANTGGATTIEYELNSYYDNTAAAAINGGGIRVKRLSSSDGLSSGNTIVTNYNYNDPATGTTSGKPINLPSYAFTIPYTGSGTDEAKWAASTVRSENDMAEEDETIIYKNVSVSRTGSGVVRYEYEIPGTFWDASASPDWLPTTVYSGRIACTTATFATTQRNNYPYAPNPNFDFERGLLKKVSTYSEAGQQISEENYTYQRSFTNPIVITGLKFENNTSTARNYAKYNILTTTSKLTVQQTSKVFDLPALTTFKTKTITYKYESPNHKLLTSVETHNSDGSISKAFTKYVKDYATTLGADSMANSLYRMNQANQNVPIEQYQQIQRVGTTFTTGASLTLYKNVLAAGVRDKPSQSLSFVSPSGVLDFQPSSISGNTLTKDSRYEVKANYLSYDNMGILQMADNNKRQQVTTLTDHKSNQPFAVFTNALLSEIAYNDFDTPYIGAGFTFTDTVASTNARTGKTAATLKTTSVISRAMTRNPQAANNIFSIWVNTTATGTLTVQLTDGTNTYSYPINYANTSGKWRFYQVKTALSSLANSFTCKLIAGANVLVDDILFYPEHAIVQTAAYDQETLAKTSNTDMNGVSVYYTYDTYGRLKTILDQDKNIVQRKSYLKPDDYTNFNSSFNLYFSYVQGDVLNYNNQLTFRDRVDAELDGNIRTYDFGDGTPAVTGPGTVITESEFGQTVEYRTFTHTYTQPGNYTVSLTKTSPVIGTKTLTKTVQIYDHSTVKLPLYTTGRQGAAITNVEFSGTGLGKEQTQSGTSYVVNQGVYTVTVTTSGSQFNSVTGNGFKCVYIQCGSQVLGCINYKSTSNVYTFYGIDLNGKSDMSVILSESSCNPNWPIGGGVSLTTPPPSEEQ
ncbi:PKD domain-containing protein [Mucilaginibacter sp. JRF]|uniref:PKD domain-containing protein n=1 Tax=Mucilaginibacter sp. JRF TaxID=2780088 RepID=UPI00187E037A|nr:PKD domain-containing protein [Mucilaginibacter sp. JRF]MBE9586953.1 PKD domain-containing protein [Mucilaginibacter sp. JRF]